MMNNMLLLVVLLLEVMTVLQCLQIAFKKEVGFDKYTVGIIVIDVSVYMIINLKMIPEICVIPLYILIYIYCYIEYKQTIVKTMIGFVIGFVLVGCLEGVLTFICTFFKNESNSDYVLLILNVIALAVAYFGKRITIRVKSEKIIKYSRDIYWVTILLGVTMALLLLDYYFIRKLVNIYIVCILFFLLLLLLFVYRLEKARNEIERKNYELELQRAYGGAYEELLATVRRRQHDFKNQLGAIYSMHLVANSLEELICMQNEYGDTIRYDSKFDSILTGCNNPILAGYLYHRCVACEQNGILVHYNIQLDQAECRFQLHEIIEILGILIDNACESFTTYQTEYKQIKIECLENEKEIMLCVSNPSNYVTYSDIEKMFEKGFSTKGENRGIGLARVLELTKRCDAELKVSNTTHGDNNWIEFRIRIIK